MRILIMLMRTGIWSLKFKFCRSKSCPSILYLPRKVIQCAGIGTLSLRKVLLPCKLQVMSSRNVPERRRVAPRGRILGDKYLWSCQISTVPHILDLHNLSIGALSDLWLYLQEGGEDGCCSLSCLKFSLYIYNIVALVSGLCLLAVSLWILLDSEHAPYSSFSSSYTLLAWAALGTYGSCWTASMHPTPPSPPPTHYSLGRP